MKKNNKKGFMVTELLVTSTLVCTVLICLYAQFSSVKKSYEKSFKYDTVNGLYALANVRDYLIDNGSEVLQANLLVNPYVDLTDINSIDISIDNPEYWNILLDKLNIKYLFFTNENLSDLESKLDTLPDEYEDLKTFIRHIDYNKEGNSYRLIVEYEDYTFASLLVRR